MAQGVGWNQWTLGKVKDVTMKKFWTWTELYGLDIDRDSYSGAKRCIDSDKEIWFDLGKSMRK